MTFGICCFADWAGAQDMRIFTRIYAGGSEQPVVRSLMLFHGGKVYDYIEPAEEVTVFEPSLKRFTVLNKSRQLSSELSQEEIRRFLPLAEDEAKKQLETIPPGKALEILQFQLQPNFTATFDAARSQLSLSSPQFQYVVRGSAPPTPDVVEKYLHVADWTAQLNSVLHPHSLLPSPRMILNQELRQRGLIPETVDLKVDGESSIHLEARHDWTWNLKGPDRQLILDWERLLQGTELRKIPFRNFQQEMLKPRLARK